jgi:2-iminobutanoate/2-iminopropanoate deaminase
VLPSSGEAAGSSFEVQAQQAFKNLDTVLRAGGSRLDLVVNTTVLVTDISNFAELNRLFAESSRTILLLGWLCRSRSRKDC